MGGLPPLKVYPPPAEGNAGMPIKGMGNDPFSHFCQIDSHCIYPK